MVVVVGGNKQKKTPPGILIYKDINNILIASFYVAL